MKISTRFEVFKRDNFTCQYCGKKVPEVVLEVDHIIPKSKRGNNDIDNLITSCWDCNRGKRNKLLTDKQAKGKIKENLLKIKEQEKQLKEYSRFLSQQERRKNRDIKKICEAWEIIYDGKYTLNERGIASLSTLLNKFTKNEILDALKIAVKISEPENRFKYMCGVLHNWKPTPERELVNYWKEKPHGGHYLPIYVLRGWLRKSSVEEIKDAMDEADGYWAILKEIMQNKNDDETARHQVLA